MKTLRPITPHSILTEKLKQLRNDPSLKETSDNFQKELNRVYLLASGLDKYLEENTTSEPSSLASLSQETRKFDWETDRGKHDVFLEAEMLSGHVEGQFLKTLVSATKSKNILEIGMFTGYSAISMARGLPDDGELIACEIDAEAAAIAEKSIRSAGLEKKIKIIIGPAMDTLKKISKQNLTFDFIFVDADKNNYTNYVRYILKSNLLRIGGLCVVDNTLLQGEVYLDRVDRSEAGHAINLFNQYLNNEKQMEQVIIPLRDGVTVSERVK